ncbi:MAG: DUF945 family protein [Aquitalea sp.]|nr:DUF945 family protein [Aquitalea sp.]
MKAIKAVAATLALAVAAWFGIAPGIVGMRTEDKMRNDFALLANSTAGKLLSLQQFDRGWFSSTARAQLTLPLGNQLQHLQVDYRINQLPLPFIRWSQTETTLSPLDEQGKPGTPLPLTITTIRRTDGTNDSHISGRDITLGNGSGTLTFSIEGQAQTHEGQPVSYALSLPSVNYQLAAAGGTGLALRINDLKLNGSLAAFSSPDTAWASQTSQQFGEASLQAGATPLARFGPSQLDINISDKGGNFDISYRTHLNTLKLTLPGLPELNPDNIHIDFSYRNLNKQAFTAWQTEAMALGNHADLRSNPAAMQQQSMALLYKHMGSFLAQSPSFDLERLSVHMPQGSIQGNFFFGFDGSGLKPAEITPAWLAAQGQRRSTLKAGLSVERGLLDTLLPRNGSAEQMAQARASADAMLAQWQSRGLIKDDGKTISTSLQIDSNGVKANGQPVSSLPAALAGMNTAQPPAATSPVPAPATPPITAPLITAPASQASPQAMVTPPPPASPPATQAPALPAANMAAAPEAGEKTPAAAHSNKLPGPQVDLRHCLSLSSDRAIMRCANH